MTKSHIGKSCYYSPALPATNDAAGFEALSWTKINGFQGGAQFGKEHADIDVEDLESGDTTTLKGMASYTTSTMTFRRVASDAGQIAIKTLADTGGTVGSVKIIRASGAAGAPVTGDPVQYAQGYFKTYTEIEQTGSTHEGFTVQFKQNAAHIDATEPS